MEIVKYFSLVDVAWAAAPPSAAVSDLDIIPLILNAGPVVKAVMLILLLFSVACWGIIFAKLVQLSRAKKQTAEFLDIFWGSPNLSTAYHETRHLEASPVAAIFRLGYIELGKLMQTQTSGDSGDRDPLGTIAVRGAGLENVNRSLRRAMNSESDRLSRAIDVSGYYRQHRSFYRTFWHGLGDYDLLSGYRSEGQRQSGGGGAGDLRSPGGHGRGSGRSHPGSCGL